jgi:hypothetical protein
MNHLRIDFKLLIILTLAFILMTVIGTLTHELGHYTVSKLLGYEARINYQSSGYWNTEMFDYFDEVNKKYSNEIKNNTDFPGKERYQALADKYKKDFIWIAAAGPLQTILTGTIGLFLLLFFRNKLFKSSHLNLVAWAFIFMSLFWLRQIANLFMCLLMVVFKGQVIPRGDEMVLALNLGFNLWSIQIITGILGVVVLLIVIRLMPKPILLTFLVSGLFGGVLGYYLWLIKLGPYIMP